METDVNNMSKAERYYEKWFNDASQARTVNELLDVFVKDIPVSIKEKFRRDWQRYLNKKFRGDLEKSRKCILEEILRNENDYFTSDAWL